MIFRDSALDYADAGIAIFPCKPGDKAPLTPNGFKDATTEREVIDAWRTVYPNANLGAPVPVDEVVIDIDPKNGGFNSFAQLEAKYGSLPHTFTVRTGSGGQHRRFKYSGITIKWRKNLDKLGFPGIDLKVTGGYVVLPPSYTTDEVRTDDNGKIWYRFPRLAEERKAVAEARAKAAPPALGQVIFSSDDAKLPQ